MSMSEREDSRQRFREELGGRIATTAAKFPTKAAASAAAGVSLEQFNKWIRGTVKVPVDGLKALADAASVDFVWLATGKRALPERHGTLGESDLVAIGEAIARVVLQCSKEHNVRLSDQAFCNEVMRRLSQLLRKADESNDREILLSLMPWLKLQIYRDAVLPVSRAH